MSHGQMERTCLRLREGDEGGSKEKNSSPLISPKSPGKMDKHK